MHHTTLQQQADQDGVSPEELFEECAELGVPIVHGRVDRTLLSQARQAAARGEAPSAAAAPASGPSAAGSAS